MKHSKSLIIIILMVLLTQVCRANSLVPATQDEPETRYAVGTNALEAQIDTEELILRDSLAQLGQFYNRPALVKMLTHTQNIVLTFDDGPHPRTTPKVLEILKRRNIKAIFFVLGLQANKYPHLVKQIHDDGHEIGNHSYSHVNFTQVSRENVEKEIARSNDLIEKITGIRPRYLRPPYGAVNRQVINIARENGLDIMLWTIDPKDWQNKNSAITLRNLEQQTGLNGRFRGGVVLLHDIYQTNISVLETYLDRLAINNFSITTIDALNNDNHKNSIWAAKTPVTSERIKVKIPFTPDPKTNRLLTELYKKPFIEEFSQLGAIKASRNNELLFYLTKTARVN